MRKELLKGLNEEQIEKASKCHSAEELLALAKNEHLELNEEQLAAVNGGCGDPSPRISTCPSCGAQVSGEYVETTPGDGRYHFICPNCNDSWKEK